MIKVKIISEREDVTDSIKLAISSEIKRLEIGLNRTNKEIKKFEEKYECPVIINTSFNVRGEPIVCSPEDAYVCFMRTNMDYLIMGNYLIEKKDQKPLDKDINWLKKYEID